MTHRSILALGGALMALTASLAAHAQTLEQHTVVAHKTVTMAPNQVGGGGCRTMGPGATGTAPVDYIQPYKKSMRQQFLEMQGIKARTAAPATGATKTATRDPRVAGPRQIHWDGGDPHNASLVHASGSIASWDPNLDDSPC